MKEQDQEKNFKDILRQKAAGFSMEPSDDVWANVKISLKEEKRRRRFLWLWPAAIAMLIGSGTLGWLLSSYNDQKAIIAITESSVTTSDAEKGMSQAVPRDQQFSGTPGQKPAEVVAVFPTGKNKTEASSPLNEKAYHGSSDDNSVSSHGNSASAREKDALHNDEITLPDATAFFAKTDATENDNNETPVADVFDKSSTGTDSADEPEMVNAAGNKEVSPAETTVVLPAVNSKTGRFCLQAEVMPLVSYRSLSVKSSMNTNKTVTDLADSLTVLANNNSKPVAGYATGIRGSYRFSEKWGITAALHFSNTGYHLSVPSPGTFADNFGSTGTTSLDSAWDYPGGIVASSNSSAAYYIYQPGYGYEFEERFKRLDFSAQLEWIFWQKNKNELSAAAGAGISHLLQYKSTSTATEIQTGSLTTSNVNGSLDEWSKYGMLTMASVDYRRILSKHFSLSGGLSFTYHLTNSLGGDFYSVEHPYWLGTNIGVGYCF